MEENSDLYNPPPISSTSCNSLLLSQTQLMKLPKNLFAKTTTIKNTGHMLELMHRVISSVDAHIDSELQRAPHLKTVIQLLEKKWKAVSLVLCLKYISQKGKLSRQKLIG